MVIRLSRPKYQFWRGYSQGCFFVQIRFLNQYFDLDVFTVIEKMEGVKLRKGWACHIPNYDRPKGSNWLALAAMTMGEKVHMVKEKNGCHCQPLARLERRSSALKNRFIDRFRNTTERGLHLVPHNPTLQGGK